MTYGRPAAIVMMALTCLSCGGGSSGFRPRQAELAAIQLSAETGSCEVAPGGIDVCATPAGPGSGATCDDAGPGCSFTLSVDLHGLEPGSAIIAAVEPEDLSLPWRTSVKVLGPADANGDLAGSLNFVTEIEPGTVALRAILVYPPGDSPPELGADGMDVDLLDDLGASRADVLVDWPVD